MALTVSGITVTNKTYNGKTAATLVTGGAALVGVESSDTGNVSLVTSGENAVFAIKTVGVNIGVTVTGLTLGGSAAGDYTLTEPTLTGNIVARPIIVSAITDQNKVYDGTTNATINTTGAVLSGVLASDIANVTLVTSGATGAFSSADVGTGLTVTISGLYLTGSTSSNYSISVTNPTANITALPLTVSGVTANNKTYDGTTTATLSTGSAALVGVVSGDTSNVTLNTGSAAGVFSTANAGNGLTVTVSGLAISGSAASNYTLTQPTTTANITPVTLTVTGITANSRAANGTAAAVLNLGGATLVGVLSGDTSNVSIVTSGAVGTFTSITAGTNITVDISGLTLSGSAAGNYVLTQPTTTANLT